MKRFFLIICAYCMGLNIVSSVEADEAVKYVDRIIIEPHTSSISINDEVTFRIGTLLRGNIEDYKFQVLQLQTKNGIREWTPIQDYQPYPLPSFKSKYVGPSALHVNILGPGGKVQSIWVGDYYFHDNKREYPSLLRAMLADDFEDISIDKQFERLANEFSFFVAASYAREGVCLKDCNIREKGSLLTGKIRDKSYEYDKKSKILSSSGSPVLINISAFSQYDEIVAGLKKNGFISRWSVKEKDNDVIVSAFAAQLFYRGYRPGTPTFGYLYSLNQSQSMCNVHSYQLTAFLSRFGIDTDFISYASAEGGEHAYVEVKLKNKTLLLDAFEGQIYLGSTEDLLNGKKLKSYHLPYYYEHGIDLNQQVPEAKVVYSSDEIIMELGQARHNDAVQLK